MYDVNEKNKVLNYLNEIIYLKENEYQLEETKYMKIAKEELENDIEALKRTMKIIEDCNKMYYYRILLHRLNGLEGTEVITTVKAHSEQEAIIIALNDSDYDDYGEQTVEQLCQYYHDFEIADIKEIIKVRTATEIKDIKKINDDDELL